MKETTRGKVRNYEEGYAAALPIVAHVLYQNVPKPRNEEKCPTLEES